MSNLFWLRDAQMARLQPFFRNMARPRPSTIARAVDVSGGAPLVRAQPRTGCLRPDDGRAGRGGCHPEGGDDRCERACAIGPSMPAQVSQGTPHGDPPAGEKGGPGDQRGRLIGRTKGGMNTKLHAVTDADGRPIRFFITASRDSDYTGAAALLGSLPKADWLLADRDHDAERFTDALKDKGESPASPVGSLAVSPSSTTSAAANAATGPRSCSGV